MSLRKKINNWKHKRHIKKFGDKNIGYFNHFDETWFKKYQKQLLFLLNHKLFKYWSRWILRINDEVNPNEKIHEIKPESYTIKLSEKDKVSEFRKVLRTHNKFSKRIYYAFRPIWWAIHYWDTVFANKLMPELNFGFDTFTGYPEASSGTYTCDGYANYTYSGTGSSAWATVRTHTDSAVDVTGATLAPQGSMSALYTWIWRAYFSFKTQDIADDAIISAATISFVFDTGGYSEQTANGATCYIVESTQANPNSLTGADYDNVGTTSFGSKVRTDITFDASTYTTITLNASGVAAISKTAATKLAMRLGTDFDNLCPAVGEYNHLVFYAADDDPGTARDPKLVVTYSVGYIKTINGLAKASVKTVNGLAFANVKTINGVT